MKSEFVNGENETINTPQNLYDSFNEFIFSDDIKVFSKLIARSQLFNQTINVPGDIIECGVFKGSGILTWLKLKKTLSPNAFKKIIGFDFFDTEKLLSTLSGKDKERMGNLFSSRNFELTEDYSNILNLTIEEAGFERGDYELVKGDICETSKDFVSKRPGLKISLLYMDLDVEIPTYEALESFWPNVSKGGIIVLDEYGYHQWSESIGVDRFVDKHKLRVLPLSHNAPTAYIIKE